MHASVKLGKIWGIPIGLHASWFLVFGLVTWSLATGYFPAEFPSLSTPAYWVLGAVTSILFFGSVLVHELGHAYLALHEGIPVNGITLFIFGGVAQISREPQSPGAELRIAIAGPITSLALAAGFGALWWIDQPVSMLAAPSLWLARINFMLAAFNMIPGFPLDGGRVLRAIVWRVTNSYLRATRVASFTGQVVAFGFIGVGVLTIFGGNFFNGIWLAFIGWFLQNAAAASYAQANMQQSLRGLTAWQAMTRDCVRVPNDLSLEELVERLVLGRAERCFFVTTNGTLEGMLTLTDVTQTPRSNWQTVTTGQTMRRREELISIQPNTELLTALQAMDDANVNQVPVMDGEALLGVLSREQVLRYVRLRAQLGL
jgi:Zn-dependent protease/CBS domain-containing protein